MKGTKNNNIIKYEELGKISNIIYSYYSEWTRTEYITKIINNCENIICENYEKEKLEKTIEIEQEIWRNLINKLFKIIKQRNYYWNKNYSIAGNEKVFDVSPWKIEIKNKIGECFEINCKGKAPEIFNDFLEIIYDIYYKK